MPRLAINLVTRSRPALLLETLEKTIPNIADPNTLLMVSLDDDDRGSLLAICNTPSIANRVKLSVKPREDSVGKKCNRILAEPADVYMIMVDHSEQLTPGFDVKILEAANLFPDGIGVVFNHMANASFTYYNAITAKWAEIVGEYYPTHFPFWFIDHWLDDVARVVGRISFVDAVTNSQRKPPTQEMREPAWWATWFDAAVGMRRQQEQKLIDALDEPEWRKKILRAHHPLVEFRSRWVNDSVRQIPGAGPPHDERYLRIKQRAIDMLPALLDQLTPAEAVAYRNALIPPTMIQNIPQLYPVRVAA